MQLKKSCGGGRDMAYSWKVLANDWSALTDTEKEALFVGTNYQLCA